MTLFLFIPNFFLRRYKSNRCYSQYAFDGPVIELFFQVQAYLWMLFNYLLPAVIMISSHAYVIHVLRHPTPGQQRGRQVQNSVRRLILTTSLMAGLLLMLHLYEAIRYILANSNVIRYAAGTAIQQVGALLITLSSVLNPCVLIATSYTVRMQVIRSVLRYDAVNTNVSRTNETNVNN
ncbi:amine GPCR [Clonorchis sinensis]|uniref:Amine GPCR n=1 Tax=Clonorchis sinensis TaxID=79923 RepID=H2KP21_CLOSI|nr:amine GPCR [Clonorchis sinensis]